MADRNGPWTLGELAGLLGGDLEGPREKVISRPVATHTRDASGIAFCESEGYVSEAKASGVGAVILRRGADALGLPAIFVDHPRLAFGKLLFLSAQTPPLAEGVHSTAVVAGNASIGEGARIGPYAVIEEDASIGARALIYPFCYVGARCRVGAGSVLYPHAVLYQDVRMGERCIVHAGAVLGADGFGFGLQDGKRMKIPQVGGVVLGDDVEIGALTAVDRATAGDTSVGDGSKLDNLIQIGHNVRLGKDAAIASQTGVSGSCVIGDRVTMAGQVALTDHAVVGNDVVLAGRSAVVKDLPDAGTYFGTPARPVGDAMRAMVLATRLPELFERLKALEEKLSRGEKES